ncbi:hypothetical protein Poli38472_010087 [Pythium oligandrum]|uniref:Glutathione synthetase n=1 Tax=Pythium oligandrum TaxID=41045 RepID=A0A8K1FH87_PYTOL|nr:hypothetical protein Poli38472_010087 [Pythium oligandrum]|eukprot:TMW58528.1 hypothetical protein Poli38472_010087 [Pythium oligandrum]
MADLLATATLGNAHASDNTLSRNDGAVLGLTQDELENVKEQAISWAAAHGMLVRYKSPEPNAATFTHIPFALLPVPLPKQQFEHGVKLSPIYGRLVDRVSRDLDWLHQTLESVVHEDKFTARLLALSKQIQAEGIQQKAYLGVHRSDYMLHEPQAENVNDTQRLLQVELNAISSSFGCISSLTSDLHHFLISRFSSEHPALEAHYKVPLAEFVSRLPKNDAIFEIPNALAAAHKHYGVSDAIIVFVVQPNEANSIDQRWIEYNLWTHHNIRVLRKTMAEVQAIGKLQERDGKRVLIVEGHEVAVAYYRSAYTPNDYPTETEWEGRTLIERSYAIKCPSIAYHLAGTKKVQQALAAPAALRRFVSEEDAVLLESSFAGLWGLEKEADETPRIKQMAIENAKSYVLKPQREGGGNNLYGAEVAEAMKTMSPQELESYILMERIFPNENPAILVRNGLTASGNTISELGMYIASLFDDGKEVLNKHAGHLLRTKLSGTDEGGVATGFSVVSSPLLV